MRPPRIHLWEPATAPESAVLRGCSQGVPCSCWGILRPTRAGTPPPHVTHRRPVEGRGPGWPPGAAGPWLLWETLSLLVLAERWPEAWSLMT